MCHKQESLYKKMNAIKYQKFILNPFQENNFLHMKTGCSFLFFKWCRNITPADFTLLYMREDAQMSYLITMQKYMYNAKVIL